jgi:hypothetical protein
VGLHGNLFKLLGRVFGPRSKNRPEADTFARNCQLMMIKVIYEFLFYFSWNNESNANELTQSSYIDMLFSQLDLDVTVVRLLTSILLDNDTANGLV